MASSRRERGRQVDISSIVQHYEDCFRRHGAVAKGVDWPDEEGLAVRFDIMLGVVEPSVERPRILDLGCGPGLLLDHISRRGQDAAIDYVGVDLSGAMIAAARERWPGNEFQCRDVVADPLPEAAVDYVIMNGVLTEKRSVSQEDMLVHARRLVVEAFRVARRGVAFNVMRAEIDRDRTDLFHWPMEDLAVFLSQDVSRWYAFRADYNPWEYTCYVLRNVRA